MVAGAPSGALVRKRTDPCQPARRLFDGSVALEAAGLAIGIVVPVRQAARENFLP
jgi:hypothetical protein